MKFYKADINASGGYTRSYGVYADSIAEALEKIKNGDATHCYDDLMSLDCQYEDCVLIDDIEESEPSDFEYSFKEGSCSDWSLLRYYSEKWYIPKRLREAIKRIA